MKLLIVLSIVLGLACTFAFLPYIKGIYIIFGQGHFILAYLYMFKAGKITFQKLLWFLGGFLLLILLYLYVFDFQTLLVFTASYFVLHFAQDSYFITGENIPIQRLLHVTLPFMFIGLSRIAEYAGFHDFAVGLIYCFPVSVLYLAFIWKKLQFMDYVFTALAILVYCSILFKIEWVYTHFLASIFLSHYIMWYFYFFKKKDAAFLKGFVLNFLIVHILLLALFFYYYNYDRTFLIAKFTFKDDFFYLWTLMHFIVTFRLANYQIRLNAKKV